MTERKGVVEGELTTEGSSVVGGGDGGDRRQILIDSLLTSLDNVMRFGDLLRGFVMTGRRRRMTPTPRPLLGDRLR